MTLSAVRKVALSGFMDAMALVGTKLRNIGPSGAYEVNTAGPISAWAHWCPACAEVHVYNVVREGGRACWGFNGNFEKPSFSPSMLIRWGNKVPGYENNPHFNGEGGICHYFLTDGRISYCGDSTHELSGQTVDLPDWPKDFL